MKPLLTLAAALAAIIALPTPSQAALGQQYIFTPGSLNGNICTAVGNTCHTPKNTYVAPAAQSMIAPAPNIVNVAPPASPGIISTIVSGLISLF